MNDALNGFNIFIISVGSKLAEEINDPLPKERGAVEDHGDRLLCLNTKKENHQYCVQV